MQKIAGVVMLEDLGGLSADLEKIENAITEVSNSSYADIGEYSGEPQIMVSLSHEANGDFETAMRDDEAEEKHSEGLFACYTRFDGEYNSVPRVV
ncbi:MAG: hypothetical protein E7672_03720 [Ruminococcaceae bacterium]|nr:hypothetical protein [Oscillospiraceae bacterium]